MFLPIAKPKIWITLILSKNVNKLLEQLEYHSCNFSGLIKKIGSNKMEYRTEVLREGEDRIESRLFTGKKTFRKENENKHNFGTNGKTQTGLQTF